MPFVGQQIIWRTKSSSQFMSSIKTCLIVEGTNVLPPNKDEVASIFNPLRQMCHHKVVKMKEAVIDDSDIVRGVLEYVERNHIQTIVLGAPSSTKNALVKSFSLRTGSKKLKGGQDVPAAIIQSAPEYTSVYVISKGKIVAARQGKQPFQRSPSESEKGVRAQAIRRGSTNCRSSRSSAYETPRSSSVNHTRESSDVCYNLSLSKTESSGSHKFDSVDIYKKDGYTRSSSDSQSSGDVESEMKVLRLKLKQTMEMYNSACKEAISAQNKAKEINQWKLEGARKVEEAKLSEEAALALAEEEKAKAIAALKATEEAMKKAEEEALRRLQAERKARREEEEKVRALTVLAQKDIRYRLYTIDEVENATQNFSMSMKLGEGGYGPVFKGQLDHTPVAIKLLNPDAHQGRKQFQQEVEILSNIRHPNLVLLLGACPDYGCLVYEFMENGTLEDRLMRKQNTPPIPWRKRFEIAAEIATTLLFLHQSKPEPLVHRDLKPGNILVDRNYVSKISDVGLARLVPASVADCVTQYYMTSAAGTFCYIDPEYQKTGMLTPKSDIYSLGIVLLQIITAKPPMGLTHHVKSAIDKGRFLDILDPAVTDWPVKEALAFAKLSLSCAELSKKDRPDLASVIVPELNRLRDYGNKQNSKP
ncbi:U-box domain-containing protein 52-like isoform X3 [Lotus japonicus]|uniref:U-box domain-containing protein 52-like isoform X3 n=1 Tax=Lotus japonicus TaxID=34305 RepID=UPI00258BC720|nr:U-box domain-containing protein 52-like isoform X3 [Lotus japonicus]